MSGGITRTGTGCVVETGSLITLVDEASATVTYVGYASPGTLEASSTWKIQKITISGSITTVLFAEGDDNFDKVWNDRASYTYS